jgi:hypothetical protein
VATFWHLNEALTAGCVNISVIKQRDTKKYIQNADHGNEKINSTGTMLDLQRFRKWFASLIVLFLSSATVKINSYPSKHRRLPQLCNQFEADHICRTEWRQTADLEVERTHNPTNKRTRVKMDNKVTKCLVASNVDIR